MTNNGITALERFTGLVLVLIGLAFFALLIFLKRTGELNGDLKVCAFMVGISAVLIYVGLRFLARDASVSKEERAIKAPKLGVFTSALEIGAMAGCLLMLGRGLSILSGHPWPSDSALEGLLVG